MTSNTRRLPRPGLVQDVADDLEELLGPDGGRTEPVLEKDLDRVVATIRNYLQPRLANRGAPFSVVFAGPTGSGKSTIINSIAGRTISPSGSLRPTTTKPLVFSDKKRSPTIDLGDVQFDIALGEAAFLNDVALIDTPDIDSTNTANHRSALGVLAAADLVVFVASAVRYADLVPWEILRSVTERGIPVIHLLNRLTPENSGSTIDFRRRLRTAKMAPRIVTISEYRLVDDRLLPATAVESLRDEIMSQVGHLNRYECLERAFASVRSDLSSMVHAVNADMVRVEQITGRMPPQTLYHDGYDPAAQAATWRSALQSSLPARWSRRRRRVLDQVVREIKSELVSLVERDLRLFALDQGSLVIDLTEGDSVPHLDRIDSTVSLWFETVALDEPTETLNSTSLRRRAESAISVFLEITDPTSSPPYSESAMNLLAGIGQIYRDVGDEMLNSSNHARVLATLQRARARIRPESTLVSA
jgi:energy-coupling factor transporter ATP-binding protein EcfA2